MPIDAWLPVGFHVPDGPLLSRPLAAGLEWQIWENRDGGRTLLAKRALAERWEGAGLVSSGLMGSLSFGQESFSVYSSGSDYRLQEVSGGRGPEDRSDALAFSLSLKATRDLGFEESLHDALYLEQTSRLLPTFSLTEPVPDDVLLGAWLTGGVRVSARSTRRLRSLTGWLDPSGLQEVVVAAGVLGQTEETRGSPTGEAEVPSESRSFRLVGRPALEAFFRDHVIDIVENRERYRVMGISFPSGFVLHGPPGCGKTYGVERLVDFLGWPSFSIDSSSVASPYIHETSKKVAQVFEEAMEHAPSVIIIDEMEAFLPHRDGVGASGQYRVEEVAEFLRLIPKAMVNEVIVAAMTNRIDMIDPAILRRGRFDHVIEVNMASCEEAELLLRDLLSRVPVTGQFDFSSLAAELAGRPMSDLSFVVREAGRLAAKAGKTEVDEASMRQALMSVTSREPRTSPRTIGFLQE